MLFKNLFFAILIFVDNMHSSGSYQYPLTVQLRMMKRFNSLPVIRTKSMYDFKNNTYDEFVYKK